MRKNADVQLLAKIGRNVRNRRNELGITQERLAEVVGCHPNHIGRFERAQNDITISMLSKIAFALYISITDLIQYDSYR